MWSTGSANSMCPKCPGHFAEVFPQVAHFWPGSSVPSLLSIKPPCTGIPSSSYVSGAVISATENLRTSVGDHTLNFIPPRVFADSSIILSLHLLLHKEPRRYIETHHFLQQQLECICNHYRRYFGFVAAYTTDVSALLNVVVRQQATTLTDIYFSL